MTKQIYDALPEKQDDHTSDIILWTPTHGLTNGLTTSAAIYKAYQERWMIGTDGEGESRNLVLLV